MAIASSSVSVGTTPTLIQVGDRRDFDDVKWVEVVAPAGGVTVYIGGPNVSTANGRPIAPSATVDASWSATLGVGDTLYAVVASGSQAVRVLVSRT